MSDQRIAIVTRPTPITGDVVTPFGKRWGGEIIQLSQEHISALLGGSTLAIDVESEYIVFIVPNKKTAT